MGTIIGTIIIICIFYLPSKITEWKSNNRVTPPGYHHDCEKAIEDIRKHGRQYFYEQHLKGKYDAPGEAVEFKYAKKEK